MGKENGEWLPRGSLRIGVDLDGTLCDTYGSYGFLLAFLQRIISRHLPAYDPRHSVARVAFCSGFFLPQSPTFSRSSRNS